MSKELHKAIERLKQFRDAAYGDEYGYGHGNLHGIRWPGRPRQLDLVIRVLERKENNT